MAMMSANPPVAEMRQLIDMHGAARVARALVGALVARRRKPRTAVPDTLRADVGLPPVEREMRRYWEVQ
mgnify:CR=1 FL=1